MGDPCYPPEEPQSVPRFIRSVELAALPTAIPCTRLFVDSTLRRWGARFVQADAELLAVELIRHSLQTVGVTEHVPLYLLERIDILHLRLLGFNRTIGIEVWDSATQPAQLPGYFPGEELHGLGLVDARARNWGSDVTAWGRMMWAELDVYDRTPAGLPIRVPNSSYPRPDASEQSARPGLDLIRRVRDGLEGL